MILRASLSSFDSNVTFNQGLEIERQIFNSVTSHPQSKATQYHHFTLNRIEKYPVELINDAKNTVNQMKLFLEEQILQLYELNISKEQVI